MDLPNQPPLTNTEFTIANQIEHNDNAQDDQPSSPQTKEDTYGSTQALIFTNNFPASLNSIEEYVTKKDGETYIPLHSTVILKKKRRMLYLPLRRVHQCHVLVRIQRDQNE